jgi:glyoxylase-like metal-dependent hydrolase (beta-lactamase superfamily II)
MNRIFASILAAASFVASAAPDSAALASPNGPPAQASPFTRKQLTDRIHVLLTGRAGNVGFYVGDGGVLVVDDQMMDVAEGIVAQIRQVTDQPIRWVVNTHYHTDHTGGNAIVGKGAQILGHRAMRANLLKDSFVAPNPNPVPPTVTYDGAMDVHLGDDEARLLHVDRAHAAGDSVVWFPKSNVVHMGDLHFNGLHPYMDFGSGGSGVGWVKFLDSVLATVPADAKVIPGHGDVTDVKNLRAFRDYMADLVAQVTAAVKAGTGKAEAVKAVDLAKYAGWQGEDRARQNLGNLYDEVRKSVWEAEETD